MGDSLKATHNVPFHIAAGAAKDEFHSKIMSEEEMSDDRKGWRTAWKGKVEACFQALVQQNPNDIIIVTIAGGMECQWEVDFLKSTMLQSFRKRVDMVRLKECADW